ncbi:MAG: hypothetical protein AAF762_02480 [Pseudomonadota bacterium]
MRELAAEQVNTVNVRQSDKVIVQNHKSSGSEALNAVIAAFGAGNGRNGIRAEHIRTGDHVKRCNTVGYAEALSAETFIHARAGNGPHVTVRQNAGLSIPAAGQAIALDWNDALVIRFGEDGQRVAACRLVMRPAHYLPFAFHLGRPDARADDCREGLLHHVVSAVEFPNTVTLACDIQDRSGPRLADHAPVEFPNVQDVASHARRPPASRVSAFHLARRSNARHRTRTLLPTRRRDP